MKRAEIELWAIKQLDRVEEKRAIEDSAVELKSGLQDPMKTARRIAAHANAARGEPILWIVGADEKRFEICGAKPEEVDGWFKQVASHFDGRAVPDLVDVAFDYKGKSVVALKFETDRAPYLVRDEKGRLEVPWREQTEPRSATRTELLGLLEPAHRLPEFESFNLLLSQAVTPAANAPDIWKLHADFYVIAPSSERLLIPIHRCAVSVSIDLGHREMGFKFKHLRLEGVEPANHDLNQHVVIFQAGFVKVGAKEMVPKSVESLERPAQVVLEIGTNLRQQVPPIRIDLQPSTGEPKVGDHRVRSWRGALERTRS